MQPPRSPSVDFQSSDMGFTIGPPDNTIKSTMTIPTQIQNQSVARLAHVFPRSRSIHGNLLLPLQPREDLPPTMSSSPLVDEGMFLQEHGHSFQIDHLIVHWWNGMSRSLSRVLSLSLPSNTWAVATVPTSTCNSSCLALLSKTSPRCFRYTFAFLFDSTFHVHIRTLHHLWYARNRLPPLSTLET